MAVIQSIPGVQVDIRPGDNDEESFKEYNPGEEEAAPWPKNLDPALAPEKDEDEVQCLDVPTHPPGSTPEAAVTSVEANDRPANSAKSRQPNAGTRKSKRNTSLKKTPKSRQQRPMQPKLTTEVCTRYIQASNGQSFRLCFTFLSSFIHKRYDVLADIYIDGKIVDNMLFERQDLQSDSGPGGWKSFAAGSRRIREKPGGLGGTEWQVLPWKFSDLDIDTDHYGKVSDRLKASLRNVGKITVKLWRVVIVKAGKGNHKRFNNLKARQMVPERALKGQAVSLEAG